ncbi:hypothetical protein GVAV_001517 [Gurleya vavrai]
MFKTFLSRCTSEVFVNEQNLDYNVKTFKWSPSKYEPCCISKIAEKMEKDISLFKETMNTRFTNYEKACKTIEFAFKENRGPLREIDIEMSEHEFLIEHYVIVHKARKKDFEKLIIKLEKLCQDTLEIVMTEHDNFLYKIVGLKSAKDEVKKTFLANGFFYKNALYKNDFDEKKKRNENIIAENEVIKNNFLIYINTNISDLFSIYMHVKILRLYIECVLLYGVNGCMYFVSFGKKKKLTEKWTKIVNEWKFSSRIDKKTKNLENVGHYFISDFLKYEED